MSEEFACISVKHGVLLDWEVPIWENMHCVRDDKGINFTARWMPSSTVFKMDTDEQRSDALMQYVSGSCVRYVQTVRDDVRSCSNKLVRTGSFTPEEMILLDSTTVRNEDVCRSDIRAAVQALREDAGQTLPGVTEWPR